MDFRPGFSYVGVFDAYLSADTGMEHEITKAKWIFGANNRFQEVIHLI
jgi:hypothetical protein